VKKVLALLLACTVALAACEPEKGGGNHPNKPPKPPVHQPQPQPGAQQPAPVQGDPNAHNTEAGEVDLHVSWTNPKTGTTPLCEWSKNGKSQPCANMREAVKEGNNYIGLWEHEETGKSGDVFTLNAEGQSGTEATCEIFYKGQGHPGISSKTRCSAHLAIP
jgi:hypothetical protein